MPTAPLSCPWPGWALDIPFILGSGYPVFSCCPQNHSPPCLIISQKGDLMAREAGAQQRLSSPLRRGLPRARAFCAGKLCAAAAHGDQAAGSHGKWRNCGQSSPRGWLRLPSVPARTEPWVPAGRGAVEHTHYEPSTPPGLPLEGVSWAWVCPVASPYLIFRAVGPFQDPGVQGLGSRQTPAECSREGTEPHHHLLISRPPQAPSQDILMGSSG